MENGPGTTTSAIVACHGCGTIHNRREIGGGQTAACTVCDGTLQNGPVRSFDRSLALGAAALVLFVLANSLPFLTFELEGRDIAANLWQGAIALWGAGMWPLSLLVLLLATIVPGVRIGLLIFVLGAIMLGRTGPMPRQAFKLAGKLQPWAMMEVYLLGVIVAYVKLSDMAQIGLEVGLWAFALLIPVLALAESMLDSRAVWESFEPQADRRLLGRGRVRACHVCDQLVAEGQGPNCPRCYSPLHERKPDSLTRCWALLIAAAILYLPANMLPMMTVVSFGWTQTDTIISGVFALLAAGMWPVAALVFFASVVVPILKIVVLGFLLLSVQFSMIRAARDRTRLYWVIELIGRWSMVDVFMLGILTALVSLDNIASIRPGAGGLCFAAVVILTMLSAMSFDPRLIWDRQPSGDYQRA